MDQWIAFLGRFHPLVIHLPIGILVAVCVLEILRPSRKYPDDVSRSLLVGLVFAGGIAAVATGLMLEQEGGYSGSRILWHMWLGIAMTGLVGVTLVFCLLSSRNKRLIPVYRICLGLSTLLMIFGSHHGGVLTHGRHFLTEHMPFSKEASPAGSTEALAQALESGQISFDQHVRPILEVRCVECHNAEKMKADLRLDSPEAIMKGAKFGPVVVPGDPDDSSLYYLTTYPEDDEDRMPPEGEALKPEQIETFRKWIEQGAGF